MAFLEQCHHFVEFDVEVAGFDQQRIRALGQDLKFFPAGEGRGGFGNICPGTVALGDYTRPFQFQVSAGDRVGIDHELLRQHANGRDLVARRQTAGSHKLLHLIDNLNIDRHAVGGSDMDLHGFLKCINILIH